MVRRTRAARSQRSRTAGLTHARKLRRVASCPLIFSNIEAQIYVFKIAMSRYRQTHHHCVTKKKTDHADVGFVIKEIEFRTRSQVRREPPRIDREIQHPKLFSSVRQGMVWHFGRRNKNGRCSVIFAIAFKRMSSWPTFGEDLEAALLPAYRDSGWSG